jgi:dTDP-4-dehydrorhamnose reductase
MKVVILGANGLLGSDLSEACRAAGIDAACYDLPEVDITIAGGIDQLPSCDWLVNCAGYTDVDGAESDRETAFAVNCDGAGRVAAWCAGHDVSLLHVSTDYVFDGESRIPYREEDAVNPLSVYGQSKLAGERAVLKSGCAHIILRTQSLFGEHGRHFIRTIMRLVETGKRPLRVVNDQITSPTHTVHLALAILRLLKAGKEGIVHVSASGSCTWHEFACAVVNAIGVDVEIEAVSSVEFASAARRPAWSVLDKSRYEEWTGQKMPSWHEGLKAYLEEPDRAG